MVTESVISINNTCESCWQCLTKAVSALLHVICQQAGVLILGIFYSLMSMTDLWHIELLECIIAFYVQLNPGYSRGVNIVSLQSCRCCALWGPELKLDGTHSWACQMNSATWVQETVDLPCELLTKMLILLIWLLSADRVLPENCWPSSWFQTHL